ncbi:MAG: M6 family metalloprotease domain-containing protein, partial [Candidatus Eisenbacteria bacterium]
MRALAVAGASALALTLVHAAAFAVMPPASGGALPPEVRAAIALGVTRPAARAPAKSAGPVVDAGAAIQGRWNVPVLLVDFPDRRATFPASRFQPLLFDTTGAIATGSLADYYNEVSGGLLAVRGQTFGWRTLPDTANFYGNDSYGLARLAFPQNDAGLVYAALKAFDPEVDFSQYDRNGDGYVDCVFFVHSGVGAEGAAGDRSRLWSITSTLSNAWGQVAPYVTTDPRPGHPGQFMKIDQFSVLPERSAIELNKFTEIGVYCHEFGHDLGWPDLYDTSNLGGGANLGPGNWCLMATGAYGGDNHTPERPTHPCGWALWDAGWITLENLVTDGDRAFPPVADAKRAYRLWYQGEASDEWFLLENRRQAGFDSTLPGHGLLVSRIRSDVMAQRRPLNTVNSGTIPALRVEEADGRYDLKFTINRGDGRDPFPGLSGATRFADDTVPSTATYDGRPLNTSLEAIREVGSEVRAYVQLLPAGWSDPVEIGPLGAGGSLVTNNATALAADPGGDLWLATMDDASGSSEVVLRRKRFGVDWGTPIPLTNEPGLSSSPALAIDRSGRRVVAWWDTRDGNSEIYYAWSPPGGSFGPARRVTQNGAFSQLPTVAWTADGRIALAWTDGRDGGSTIYARVFAPDQEALKADVRVSYPEGFAILTNSGAPTIATAGNRVVIAYQERIAGVDEVKACVDSGAVWTVPRYVSVTDGFTSNQATLAADSDTSAWLFWRDNQTSMNEIRRARWSRLRGWDLGFDSAYRSAQPLDSPRAVTDARGDVHLLVRRTNTSGLTELVETVWHRANDVWDAGPSLLQSFKDEQLGGTAFLIDPLGRTHVVWLAIASNGRRLREIVHAAPASAPVAVPSAGAPALARAEPAPNPARGRVALALDTASPRPPGTRALLVNIAGRRIGELDAAGT